VLLTAPGENRRKESERESTQKPLARNCSKSCCWPRSGLRRDEIDKLQWSKSNGTGTPSASKPPNTVAPIGGPEADVDVDPGCSKSSEPTCPSPARLAFVIESFPLRQGRVHPHHHYRCNPPVQGMSSGCAAKVLAGAKRGSTRYGKNSARRFGAKPESTRPLSRSHQFAPCAKGVARRPAVPSRSRPACRLRWQLEWPNAVWQTSDRLVSQGARPCSMNCWSVRPRNFPATEVVSILARAATQSPLEPDRKCAAI